MTWVSVEEIAKMMQNTVESRGAGSGQAACTPNQINVEVDVAPTDFTRKPLSVRTRFEVFKRDDFQCQYCGRKSPEVVLEVDHIVPVCEGGGDDPINLRTSCWECNSGKAGMPLNSIVTGEDPHDRAVMLLERERQLREYNAVLAVEHERRESEVWELVHYWKSEQGITDKESLGTIGRNEYHWMLNALQWCPAMKIREFMDYALLRGMTKNLRYVMACARNWRYDQAASDDMKRLGPE